MHLINRIFPNDGVIMISSTCFGYSILKVSKCCFNVPARRNGDCKSPSKALVNLNVSTCDEYLSFIQWNRSAPRSASRIRTWKKACLMPPHQATCLRRFRTSTFQSTFWRDSPVFKQSFSEGLPSLALTDASKTIHILVLCAVSLPTALCGR